MIQAIIDLYLFIAGESLIEQSSLSTLTPNSATDRDKEIPDSEGEPELSIA